MGSKYRKRQEIIAGSVILILMVSTGVPSLLRGEDTRPNVVVLLADDLGWQDIGCYGGPVKTPALDALARGGIRFTDFYASAPVCSPSRATLLTGRHHLRTGVYTVIQDHIHQMHLLRSETTIAEILKSNGYQTLHVGKWHLGAPFRNMKKPWIDEHGFDDWFATDLNAAPSHRNPRNFWRNRERVGELQGFACQLVVDEALRWLDQKRDKAKPFFLNVWFHEPHAPLAAPADIVSEYGELNDPAALYSATIDNTDRAIARLIEKLKACGDLENTIIFYLSDHGSYRQERNGKWRNGKGSLLEGGIRTPGIVSWPKRIKGGRIEETPAGAIDILPTICGLAGIEVPKNLQLDGTDLTPILLSENENLKRSKPLTWHSPLSQPMVAIREGEYSLVGWRDKEYPKDQVAIRKVMDQMREILEKELDRKLTPAQLWDQCYNSRLNTPEWNRLRNQFVTLNTFQESWIPMIKSGSGGVGRFELFDLSVDPGQRKNIAKDHPGILKDLKKKLMSVHSEVLSESPLWSVDEKGKSGLKIHRLESKQRSRFDAFAYVNRIPLKMEQDETADDLAGRILGRLANQEGRVLVKLPPGMGRPAYEGFKTAMQTGKELHSGRCVQCHQLPGFSRLDSSPPVPTLRNLGGAVRNLPKILNNKNHHDIRLGEGDVTKLQSWLQTLDDVKEDDFRDLIIGSKVMDTLGEK